MNRIGRRATFAMLLIVAIVDTEGERGSVLIPHRERPPKRRPQPGLGWDRIPFVAPLSEDRSTTPRNSPINMAGPMS